MRLCVSMLWRLPMVDVPGVSYRDGADMFDGYQPGLFPYFNLA